MKPRAIWKTAQCACAGLAFTFCAIAQNAVPKPRMAEEVFKNVQVLKGIPVDEFMETMGVFSAALGLSCEDCHASNDSKWENYALDTSPKKQVARRMIAMMAKINRENFGGRQMVTCYSCHRGANAPKVTPNLATLYNTPMDPDDLVTQAPNAPKPEEILDKYIAALGGAQKLSALMSIVATGTSAGYGPESDKRKIEIYAKAPNQRTTVIHTRNGDNTTVYDGRSGWIAAPLRPVAVLPITGQELDGARLDAGMMFPGQIKQLLGNWRAGFAQTIDDRDMQVVQGTSPGGMIATFYFDAETNLLRRMVRYAASPVGRIPTQVDYLEYRDVDGVKVPTRFTVAWLDGTERFELTDVKPNAAIDPSKFSMPAPSAAK